LREEHLISLLGLDSCPSKNFVDCDRSETIFGIEFSEHALAVSEATLEGSWANLKHSQEFPELGAKSVSRNEDETAALSGTKNSNISGVYAKKQLYHTCHCFGDASPDSSFRDLVRRIPQEHGLIDQFLWIGEKSVNLNFAAARGAALRVRAETIEGCFICIPMPDCALADGHPYRGFYQ
jgi:hypothetical protein